MVDYPSHDFCQEIVAKDDEGSLTFYLAGVSDRSSFGEVGLDEFLLIKIASNHTEEKSRSKFSAEQREDRQRYYEISVSKIEQRFLNNENYV